MESRVIIWVCELCSQPHVWNNKQGRWHRYEDENEDKDEDENEDKDEDENEDSGLFTAVCHDSAGFFCPRHFRQNW